MLVILSRKEYQKLIHDNKELFDDCDQLARENDRLRSELKLLEMKIQSDLKMFRAKI